MSSFPLFAMSLSSRGPGGSLLMLRLLVLLMLHPLSNAASAAEAPPPQGAPHPPHPFATGLPVPGDAIEAEVLAALAPGQVVPFRAMKGGGGLDGSRIRPGDALTLGQLMAMFMDDISSLIRKAWSILWLPQTQRALSLADEKKAGLADAQEAERLAVREKARVFAHLNYLSRYFVNERLQRYKLLQNKVYFKYFAEHVNSAVEFALLYSLKLLARPLVPVGELAYLAEEELKAEDTEGPDSETQTLTLDGRLIPASPNLLPRP
ncbi:hypothetical protein Efla_001527 [Eimeria flavescens]